MRVRCSFECEVEDGLSGAELEDAVLDEAAIDLAMHTSEDQAYLKDMNFKVEKVNL